MIIYVDLDNTLCDHSGAIKAGKKAIEYPQSRPGFFVNLKPLPGALEAVEFLKTLGIVYIATAPSLKNPHSYTEKRLWIDKYLGAGFAERLIIIPNKSLLIGDVLIDDRIEGQGQENFKGRLIQYGGPIIPNWVYFLKRAKEFVSLL